MTTSFQFLNPGVLVDDGLERVLVEPYSGDTAKSSVPGYDFEMRKRLTGAVMGHIRFRVANIGGILNLERAATTTDGTDDTDFRGRER